MALLLACALPNGAPYEVERKYQWVLDRRFFEAKLYSSVSPAAPPDKPHDQITRKLRVGLDSVEACDRDLAARS